MTEDAAINDPLTPSGGGERRRALRAERDRHDESPVAESGPPPPPALVRPYARMAAPTAPVPVVEEPGAEPTPSGEEETVADGGHDADAEADPPDDDPPDADRLDDDPRDATLPDATPLGTGPDAEHRPHDFRDPRMDHDPGEHAPARLPDSAPPVPPLDQPDSTAAEIPALPRDGIEPGEPAESLAWSDGRRNTPPEMAPPGWSAFTPVIPPEPPPFDADHPPSGGWEHVSLRRGDDDSWLRVLTGHVDREPWEASTSGRSVDARLEAGVEPPARPPAFALDAVDEPEDEPARPEEPEEPEEGDSPLSSGLRPSFGRAPADRLSQAFSRSGDPAGGPPVDVAGVEEFGDVPATSRAASPGAGVADRAPDDAVNGFGSDRAGAGPGWVELVDGFRPDDAVDRPVPEDAAHGNAPDEVVHGNAPDEVAQGYAPDEEEPVRGTLAPVLRRSTERAKYPTSTTPVIRPPVLPPPLGEIPPAPRVRAVSWDEALAGDVVPGTAGRRRGRRAAKARHESAGAAEYRPRAAPDHSLTLLVVVMLLVLLVLVGVAVRVFWPRLTGTASPPAPSATAPGATRQG